MKRIYFLKIASVLLLIPCLQMSAQPASCSNPTSRYHDVVFPGQPIKTSNLLYGNNIKFDGSPMDLYMDIYEPACDLSTNRPLLILCHGGAFMTGDRTDMDSLCKNFARMGYVTATISYRLGGAQADMLGAITRGTHDARAAVRWFRQNIATGGNTYKLDPSNIVFGGASAGGYIALHLAYMDQPGELISSVDDGTVEGNSGNPGYSSAVKAIVSICGSLYNLSFIQNNDIPVALIHGDQDQTVPIDGSFGNYGSRPIAGQCASTGTEHCFKICYGEGHQIGSSNPLYIDTLFVVMRNFLEKQMCGGTLQCNYTAGPAILIPSVSVTITSGTNPTCQGSAVTFTATAVNPGQASPVYQWQVNGVNVGTNSSTYSSTTLSNTDVVTCSINTGCTTVSPGITMNVKPTGPPTISIAITSGTTPMCLNAGLTFTAASINGGATPAYQWKKNGVSVGTNSTTFSSTTIANGDVITCDISLPPSSTCASQTTASSNAITITVVNPVTPSVSFVITSGTNPSCVGASVTFTATPVNGGTTPVYQWQVNGINAGTNNANFSTTTLADNDVVSCTLSSSVFCATPANATGSPITITVLPPSPSPTVSIAITFGANPTCGGLSVAFTATATNGGTTPAYQWKVNGTNVGTSLSTYASTTLTTGDVVNCVVTTNAPCAATPTVTSNSITMSVSPSVAPSIAVVVTSGSNQVCAGSTAPVMFTATASNAGTSPVYQWYLNGSQINGAQSPTYTLTTLVDNDEIACKVISNASCASPASITSADITILVTQAPVVNFMTNVSVCGGNLNATSFSSTPSGATYTWSNSNTTIGLAASGTGDVPAFVAVNATTAPVIATITITPTLNGCVGTPSSYTITVDPTATITQSGTVLTSSTSSTYQWYLDGQPVTGATGQTCTATQNGDYSVVVAGYACPSEVITIGGVGINQLNNNYFFTVYPNPNDGNFNISFDVITKANYKVELKNSLGALVYEELLVNFNGSYSKQMDVTKYGRGIYLISLSNSENASIKKMIVY